MTGRGAVGVIGALLVACTGGARQEADERPVLRAWDPLVAADARVVKRAAGEDCTATGRNGCADGACLHLEPHADRGYFCSKRCSFDDDCPEAWGCRPMVPGDAVSHCVPPKGWAARVAPARRVMTSVRRPAMPTVLPPPPIDGGVR